MAKPAAVWGIDIGQCALKALRCEVGQDDAHIVATAFDYIEYPKILSQPEADPVELVRDAINLFLSRNSVRGDKVSISVSGQSGLARFIKLPPVESKKIPDIVKYEARQQIPFALEDVVWDYQQMAGGSEEEGFALETEVGLFAMKRDQVYRSLKPLDDAGIEVEIIQLTPLAIYNYTVFDQMYDLPPADQYDPDNPPESVVVLSLGTDSTDLVITNGYRVWQRSIPLGGNHFTKALTKELRLTFAKAEHLKRNATQAEDPKAVFQAMRPVFNDLLTELQRSVGYFTSIDRSAKIGRVIALGNAMKLPGLQKYLSQNLGHPIAEVEAYRGLGGPTVTSSPVFKENLLSFAVSYGLALQGLGKAQLATNLLPDEIVTDRLIRAKKPWAVAAVAVLLLGCAVNFFGHWLSWNSTQLETKWAAPSQQAATLQRTADELKQRYTATEERFAALNQVGQNMVSGVDGRLLWIELLKAIGEGLPKEGNRSEDISLRPTLYVDALNCQHFPDLQIWYRSNAATITAEESLNAPAAPATPPPDANAGDAAAGGTGEGPQGAGWVVEIKGHHFHNKRGTGDTELNHVRNTLVKHLRQGSIELPDADGVNKPVAMTDLGVSYPVLVSPTRIRTTEIRDAHGNAIPVNRQDFVLQFCWQPRTRSERAGKVADTASMQTADTAPVSESH